MAQQQTVDAPDDQTRLRDTAADFVALRGALQQAGALAVVNASPATRYRLDVLNTRAASIQKAIESVGKMIDGARRWFSDTFGTDVEESVPLANPAIAASIQTSIAGMNYFMRDAKAELDRIIAKQKQYEALPADKKDSALSELRAEGTPQPEENKVIATLRTVPKWVWIGGALAVGMYLVQRGDND